MSERDGHAEQVILYVVILLVSIVPIAIALSQGGEFGAEPTIGLVMLVLALAGLAATWRVARRQR
jgi:hypothetical protein